MNKTLNILVLLPVLCVLSFAVAKADPDSEPMYKSAAAIQAGLPANVDGKLVVDRIVSGKRIQVMAARAVHQTGGTEMHRAIDVFYYVQAGHADVLVGTKVEGGKYTTPDEWSGGKIVGGHTYSLSAGDILLMPAGSAHQVNVPKGGSFTYIVFRDVAAGK